MGKRIGFLINDIADPDNLRLAFWKARKGKEEKPEVIEFRKQLDTNLLSLRSDMLDGSVEVGNYHYFTIYDPKERVICAAPFRQRVFHHAIMNICHPIFEKFQIRLIYKTWFNILFLSKYFVDVFHFIWMSRIG